MAVIGVDFGGTKINASLIDKGKVLKCQIVSTGFSQDEIYRNLCRAIDSVYSKNVKGIGIGVPGSVDIKKGIFVSAANLPIKNLKLKSLLEKKYKTKVAIDNDVNAFTLGEARYGAGAKESNVVGITLGTGVGGGLVIEGKLYRGRGSSCEFGHITIKYDSEEVKSNNRGDFECFVSRDVITISANKLGANSPLELFELAKKGNKDAIKIWEDIGTHLGVLVYNIYRFLDPDIIIFGGNISNAWEYFNKFIIKEAAFRASGHRLPKLVRAKLKNSAMGPSCLVEESLKGKTQK